MRILLLNYEYPPLGLGAATATENLLKEFAHYKNLKIDLITSSIDQFKKEKIGEKINIYKLNIYKNKKKLHAQSNLDLIIYSIKAYFFSKKLIQKNNYHLIHAFFGIPSGFIAMLLNQSYIVSLRGSDVPFYSRKYYLLDLLFFRHLSKIIWKKAKFVIANSEGLKKLALKNKPDQKISVIYNGVNTEKFKPKSKKGNSFRIVSASRLVERKGFIYALNAFIKFEKKYPNSKLIFAGDGPTKTKLEEVTKSSKLNEKVQFLGVVSRDNIPNVYKKSDVFVLPSLNEGMSNSLLEAMASGLAIITTNTGGTKELVDSSNGIIVKMKSSKEIFQALKKLYKNPKLLKKMQTNSGIKAQTLNWQTAAQKYYKIYKQIKNS